MGEKLRVIARVVSLTMALARSAASGAACTLLGAGAGWTGMVLAREEATVAQRPAAPLPFQMRPVTADLFNSDEEGRLSHIRRHDRDFRASKGASTITGNFKR